MHVDDVSEVRKIRLCKPTSPINLWKNSKNQYFVILLGTPILFSTLILFWGIFLLEVLDGKFIYNFWKKAKEVGILWVVQMYTCGLFIIYCWYLKVLKSFFKKEHRNLLNVHAKHLVQIITVYLLTSAWSIFHHYLPMIHLYLHFLGIPSDAVNGVM